MEQPLGASGAKAWFHQFPAALRQLALLRLVAALGSGGVLYLTPLVFHAAAFSAAAVTTGLALAAVAGIFGRLGSGLLLDRGRRCSLPVLLAAGFAIAGDGVLLVAHSQAAFVLGQILLGSAVGLYWPAIELAVPLCCAPQPSARAFALVRSADACGIACGALIGALLASIGWLRGIYWVDILSLLGLALLLLARPLPAARSIQPTPPGGPWRQPLLPLLLITLLATAMPALLQSAQPLDLVQGGLRRPALAVGPGALLIGLQLALLLLLQWPVGQALARRPVTTGLRLSLYGFSLGCLLLAGSALLPWGLALVLAAQLPLALAEAAFLPTATETVLALTPAAHRGKAMALFSQCFAVSAVLGPLLAGQLLDLQGHAVGLWMLMAGALLAGLVPLRQLELQLEGQLEDQLEGQLAPQPLPAARSGASLGASERS